MAFKIKVFEDAPDFESLQVAKLDSFIPERASYRPYSQAKLCFSPAGLHLQLLSFETLSSPDSRIEGVLQLNGQKKQGSVFRFCLYADGRYEATANIEPANPTAAVFQLKPELHPISGEDMQGVFWGGTFNLPLYQHLDFDARSGTVFTGNFYKICEGERAHFCSFYPADFSKPLHAPENLGEFVLIDY